MTVVSSRAGFSLEVPSPMVSPRRLTVGRMLALARHDFRVIPTHLMRTTLAGSPLLPKPVRWAVYRMSGLKFASANISDSCVMHNERLDVRQRVFVNRSCYFEGHAPIVLGEDTMVGTDCAFITSTHDIGLVRGQLRVGPPEHQGITIGARNWIGSRSTFLPGSTTDSDVVVAAGSVVRGHLERGWIYGGVPAKKIKPIPEA